MGIYRVPLSAFQIPVKWIKMKRMYIENILSAKSHKLKWIFLLLLFPILIKFVLLKTVVKYTGWKWRRKCVQLIELCIRYLILFA